MRIACFSANYIPLLDAEAIVTSKWVLAMRDRGNLVDVFSMNTKPNDRVTELNLSSCLLFSLKHRSFEISKFQEINRYLNYALRYFSDSHKQKKYDLIISRYEPLTSAIAAYYAHKEYGIPWIANYNDPIPREYRIRKNISGLIDLQRKLFQESWFHELIVAPTQIVFPSQRLSKYVMTNFQKRVSQYETDIIWKKISIIPHIGGNIGSDNIIDAPKNLTSQETRIVKDTIIIRHIGYLSPNRDLSSFLEAMDLWERQEHDFKIKVEFIGNNKGQLEKIRNFKKRNRKLVQIADIGIVDYKKSLSLMIDADILLIIEEPNPESVFLPSKFCDYAMSKRPIISLTSKKSTISDYILRHGGGIVVEHGDVNGIVEAINTIISEKKILGNLSEQFSTISVIEKWEYLIKSISKQNKIV